MKAFFFAVFFAVLFQVRAEAQEDVYYTSNAVLQVAGKFQEQSLIGRNDALSVRLDYETTEVILRFYLADLKFNVDTLNELLRQDLTEVVFKGKLSLEYINTKGHPPLNFTVDGRVRAGSLESEIHGTGVLHHIADKGEYVCMLGMTILLNLADLGLDIPEGLYEEVEIIITQALLEKDKN